MSRKPITTEDVSKDVSEFLDKTAQLTPQAVGATGRLIFAMDATASRGPSWDVAMSIQAEMFYEAAALGGLEVQLVFYRGLGECRSSSWTSNSSELGRLMAKVDLLAGRTQIERVLRHAAKESSIKKVNALVFIGDAVEEEVDLLADAAGLLGLQGVPVFIFHEGGGNSARKAFEHVANITGGAYAPFDSSSAGTLAALMKAVAAFSAGGPKALENFERKNVRGTPRLMHQMRKR